MVYISYCLQQFQDLMRVAHLLKRVIYQHSNLEIKRKSEQRIVEKLKEALKPTFLSVENTTLGRNSCGQMFKIVIESPVFRQRSKVDQHKLVTSALSTEIQNIHGFNLKTREPKIETN